MREDVDKAALANRLLVTCELGQRFGADLRDLIGRFITFVLYVKYLCSASGATIYLSSREEFTKDGDS
jgi:hypothetical protein